MADTNKDALLMSKLIIENGFKIIMVDAELFDIDAVLTINDFANLISIVARDYPPTGDCYTEKMKSIVALHGYFLKEKKIIGYDRTFKKTYQINHDE